MLLYKLIVVHHTDLECYETSFNAFNKYPKCIIQYNVYCKPLERIYPDYNGNVFITDNNLHYSRQINLRSEH